MLCRGDKCLRYVLQHAVKGDAQSVVDTMDNFAYETWMMNVGDVKGAIVDAEIEKAKPQVIAEIGAFCGYSAVRFASKLRAVSGPSARYYSFEFSPHFANIAAQIVELAGLSDVVTFFVGPFSENYGKLQEQGIDHVDVRASYCFNVAASSSLTLLSRRCSSSTTTRVST